MSETDVIADPDVLSVRTPEFKRVRHAVQLGCVDCSPIEVYDSDETAH